MVVVVVVVGKIKTNGDVIETRAGCFLARMKEQ